MTVGFRFHHDEHWVEIDLNRPPREWAADAAAGARTLPGAQERPWPAEEVFASQLALLAETAQRLEPAAALVLCREPASSPVAVLEVVVGDMPEPLDTDEIVEELVLPPEVLAEEPAVDRLETRAGLALRLRQRRLADLSGRSADASGPASDRADGTAFGGEFGADADPAVIEQVMYAWPLAEQNALLAASITFVDLLMAAEMLPVTDALARGCEIVDDQRA